jgi:2-oxo-3-hexenedioate decarboxylase
MFDLGALAARLQAARLGRREVERLTAAHPALLLPEAYAVLHAGVALRERAGERVVGWKMGLTSAAKREQMGLHSPIYGILTDAMHVPDGGVFDVDSGIHPKIEPEIAFRLGRPLHTGQVSRHEALTSLDGIAAALEILDSRYLGFKYFSLPDVVADNASSSHFVVGKWISPLGIDCGALPMQMSVNGSVVAEALSSAISGHPLDSLVQLCALLADVQPSIPASAIILAGAATTAVQLAPGMSVSLHVDGLPRVQVATSAGSA